MWHRAKASPPRWSKTLGNNTIEVQGSQAAGRKQDLLSAELEGKKSRVHDFGVKSTKLKMEAGDAQSNAAALGSRVNSAVHFETPKGKKTKQKQKSFKLGGKWSFQESLLYSHK